MTLTAGSLFSGVGMFDLAFAVAGFDILFQVEIDTFCQKVLKKHAPTYWPHSTLRGDIRHEGRNTLSYVDVLFGGFPCVDISNSGKRAGVRNGERSGLWRELKRIIGELRPPYILLENVAAIVFEGRGIDIVLSELSSMGYDAKWGIVSARDVGASHLRERWWCVAYPHCERLEELQPAARIEEARFNPWAIGTHEFARNGEMDQSRVLRSADGSATRMDGYRLMSHVFPVGPNMPQPESESPRMAQGNKNTNARLKALGNGGLPQIAYPIALELKALLERE